jgi:hypothetical protein
MCTDRREAPSVRDIVTAGAGTAAMRRIINDAQHILNDVYRLDIDAEELHSATSSVQHQHCGKKIPIPHTEYSVDVWRHADDEGLGGYRRDRHQTSPNDHGGHAMRQAATKGRNCSVRDRSTSRHSSTTPD